MTPHEKKGYDNSNSGGNAVVKITYCSWDHTPETYELMRQIGRNIVHKYGAALERLAEDD